MSEEHILLTQEGMEKLRGELDYLIKEEKPDLLRRLAEARAHGDLSENAEYKAVKERKSGVEGRIHILRSVINSAEVFVPDEESANGSCVFGSFVSLSIDKGNGKPTKRKFRMVSVHESDAAAGLLSIDSPLGKELIGKSKGDLVEIEAPAGKIAYEILAVSYQA